MIDLSTGIDIEIYCECGCYLCDYHKDKQGRLIKLYLDRILRDRTETSVFSDAAYGNPVFCGKCSVKLGEVAFYKERLSLFNSGALVIGFPLERYRRMLIVGPPGSAKTTFSRELSLKTGLPHTNLDDHYWRDGWKRCPGDEWNRYIEDLCGEDRWIIDGNHERSFRQRLKNADMVVIMDPNPMLAVWRFAKRGVRRHLGFDDNLPKNIKPAMRVSFRVPWHLFKLILLYRSVSKKNIVDQCSEKGVHCRILRRRKDIAKFLYTSSILNIAPPPPLAETLAKIESPPIQ
jgi:adenylate kinase family enzyme